MPSPQARSCLAALADTATTIDDSIQYDHVLLTLDLVHEDYPCCRRKGSAGWRSDCRNQRLSTRTARLGPTGEGEPPRFDLESGMTCSVCGMDGHNSRTCEGPHLTCPNCGKPTANMNDYSERHDSDYCSPFTSPPSAGTGRQPNRLCK